MTNEEIEKFLGKVKAGENQQVKIMFKKRASLNGIFIKGHDYADLKQKNFWRIVTGLNVDEWLRSKTLDAARIFNGSEISSLALKS